MTQFPFKASFRLQQAVSSIATRIWSISRMPFIIFFSNFDRHPRIYFFKSKYSKCYMKKFKPKINESFIGRVEIDGLT